MSEAAASVQIVRTGLLTTVQDLGRPGYAHLGVPRSGAADQRALKLANRLVGNPEGAAALETTLTGCSVVLTEARWFAVTGARATVTVTAPISSGRAVSNPATATPVSLAAVRTTAVGQGVAVYAPAGSVIDIGPAQVGVRSYLAIAGGIDTECVLGSRSADLLSGIGHERPIVDGDLLPLGVPCGLPPDIPGLGLAPLRDPVDPAVLRLLPGPRDDWFAADTLAVLSGARYEVSAASNRTALRLIGPVLRRARAGELASEGLVPGAVQVPPDGQPVLFLADLPVTGGYPVIGCVHPDDLSAAAQARPGSGVRFRLAGPLA
jgi:allophanate hydrolase subunit 2